jgi:hypothetical protein
MLKNMRGINLANLGIIEWESLRFDIAQYVWFDDRKLINAFKTLFFTTAAT